MPQEKVFGNHQIIHYLPTDLYYDPSYGVTHYGDADMETNAIYGSAKNCSWVSPDDSEETGVRMKTGSGGLRFQDY